MDEQRGNDATSGLPDGNNGQPAETSKAPSGNREGRDHWPSVSDGRPSDISERRGGNEEEQLVPLVSEVYARYQGPLPPPADFRAYNEVLPDAADRILRLTEKEVDARYRMARGEVLATTIIASAALILPTAALVVAALGAVNSETFIAIGGLAAALVSAIPAIRGSRGDKK